MSVLAQVCSYKYLQRYNDVKLSKRLKTHINKTCYQTNLTHIMHFIQLLSNERNYCIRLMALEAKSTIKVVGEDISCMFQGNKSWRCVTREHVTG